MPGTHVAKGLRDLAPELVRLERDRAPVLPENPRGELREGGELRDEDPVLQLSGVAERALDPPGRVARKLDARLADEVADLPRGPAAVDIDVEIRREAEVAFAPR